MSDRRGYLLIGGAACCWGASAALGRAMFIGRFAAVAALDPLILTQARITLAAMILLPALLALRGRGVLLPPGAAARAAVLGVVGMSSSNYFYYIAIDRTNVTTAIILQYTAPIFVLVYLVARGRQRATPKRVSAVALAVIGIALVLGLGQL
ncbi:MAG TPA: DMT family transporter, partial [Terriglobales bacterium]